MKKILLIYGLFFFTIVKTLSQTSTGLSVIDTRNNNEPPNAYSHLLQVDFKNRSVIGSPGWGTFGSTMTIAQWAPDGTGDKHHQLHFNNGGIFYRSGTSNSTGWDNWQTVILGDANGNIGLGTNPQSKLHIKDGNNNIRIGDFGSSVAGIELSDGDYNSYSSVYLLGWATSFRIVTGGNSNVESNHRLVVLENGNVLIGKTTQSNTSYKLDVVGKIRANEIVVNTTGADFVFEPTYKLRTLSELETFIRTNKHLPDIAPAKEMQENGISAGEMQAKLLQKVEELTIYIIEQNKRIVELETQLKEIKSEQ